LGDLIFIGGVHGVGKGTICREICKQTNLVHISASEVLKWSEISNLTNKRVDNIQDTQDRLIVGLTKVIEENKSYLLDGHFCLFNSSESVEKVPIRIFEKIAPRLIAVVTTDVALIKKRLEKRDGKTYSLDLLECMQNTEKIYAKEISLAIRIPFVEVKNGDCTNLIKVITNLY
jgi:adenylate kinase